MDDKSQNTADLANQIAADRKCVTLPHSVPGFTPAVLRTTEAQAAAVAQAASEKARRDAQILRINNHHRSQIDLASQTI